MVARQQLEREERGAAAGRALVVEPPPQQLFLRAPAELPDRAERDRALAKVGAPYARLELVPPRLAQVGELALGARQRELVRLGRRLREGHLRDSSEGAARFRRDGAQSGSDPR